MYWYKQLKLRFDEEHALGEDLKSAIQSLMSSKKRQEIVNDLLWLYCTGSMEHIKDEQCNQIAKWIIGALRDENEQQEEKEQEEGKHWGAGDGISHNELVLPFFIKKNRPLARPPCTGACPSRLPSPAPHGGALRAPPLPSEQTLSVDAPSRSATSRCWPRTDYFLFLCLAGCLRLLRAARGHGGCAVW